MINYRNRFRYMKCYKIGFIEWIDMKCYKNGFIEWIDIKCYKNGFIEWIDMKCYKKRFREWIDRFLNTYIYCRTVLFKWSPIQRMRCPIQNGILYLTLCLINHVEYNFVFFYLKELNSVNFLYCFCTINPQVTFTVENNIFSAGK